MSRKDFEVHEDKAKQLAKKGLNQTLAKFLHDLDDKDERVAISKMLYKKSHKPDSTRQQLEFSRDGNLISANDRGIFKETFNPKTGKLKWTDMNYPKEKVLIHTDYNDETGKAIFRSVTDKMGTTTTKFDPVSGKRLSAEKPKEKLTDKKQNAEHMFEYGEWQSLAKLMHDADKNDRLAIRKEIENKSQHTKGEFAPHVEFSNDNNLKWAEGWSVAGGKYHAEFNPKTGMLISRNIDSTPSSEDVEYDSQTGEQALNVVTMKDGSTSKAKGETPN